MNLPRLAVTRPITTAMVLVSILVLGGIALVHLPLAYLPEVDVPFIGISVPYPNSNPTQIEKDITKPVEEVLSTLAGVKKLHTTSSADEAEFWLEFSWGQDLDIVRMQVSEKMEQIKPDLPPDIGEVIIYSFNTNDIPVIQARIAAEGVDLSQNYDLLESRVLNRIRRVPGVARVDLGGVEPREIDIDLILDKVKEHNVDVSALIRRLQGASSNLVLGKVSEGGLRYSARALGAFESLEAIGDMPVNEQGLRLSEIAEITYEEPPIPYGRHLDRKYAVALEVYKESTANTVDVVNAVNQVIRDDIDQDPLLQGIKVFVWEDQAEEITSGIAGLRKAGMIGAFFALLVLYLFLRRLDTTIIVSLSIPFSIVAACGVLFFMGKTLNVLSMMGLMLGVGMLVDNAIVVLESIDRTHRHEQDTQKAALHGARQVTMAVVAATSTSLIVFLPLIVGANTDLTTWLREVGIAISLALACSLFSSLTLIPLMSAHLLRKRRTQATPFMAWLEERYAGILSWLVERRLAAGLIMTAVILIGIIGIGIVLPFSLKLVDTSMFSAHVNKRLYLRYDFKDFHYKSKAERAVSQIEDYLYAHDKEFLVASIYSFYGENEAGTTIVLEREDLTDDEVKDLRQKIRENLPEIPGARVFFHEDADAGGTSTYFAVKFFGQDAGVLQHFAEEAEWRLASVEGVQDISSSFRSGQREIQVSIDREKARRLGLTAQDMSNIFSFTLGGMRLRRFNTGDREVDTWLALRLEDREDLDDLRKLQFRSSEGQPILLGDIAKFRVVEREREIRRENRKVRAAVNATYEGEDWPTARKEITDLMNAFDLPPGYSWSWNDRILEQDTQNQQMGVNFLLAIILVYLVMASLFESLAQPFAILFAILFAFPGAVWLLAATGTPFNLMSQIGLLILMGIVVNNGIVLLDHLNQLRRSGMSRETAIIQAGRDRMRPILMTAATTIMGLLPLAVRGSKISGLFYYPLARTLIGGLFSSAILTLLVLPFVNLAVEAVAAWLRGLWTSSIPRLASTPSVAPSSAAEEAGGS